MADTQPIAEEKAEATESAAEETVTPKECRICKEEDKQDQMISPCHCSGSLEYTHKECLLRWIRTKRDPNQCGVCNQPYEYKFVLRRASFLTFLSLEYRNLILAFLLTLFITGVLAFSAYLIVRMDIQTYNKYVKADGRRMPSHRNKPLSKTEFLVFKCVLALENVAAIITLWICFWLAIREEWERHYDYYYRDDATAPLPNTDHQVNRNDDVDDDDDD